MISSLLVGKKFGTYADTFLMLGLATLAEYVLNKTKQTTPIQLLDEGRHYRIQFKKPVNLEPIASLSYVNPFPPVCGQKTDRSKLPPETPIFDVVKAGEIRKLYREYLYQNRGQVETGEDAPKPPHPSTQNAAILTSMRHDKNHNELWLQGWEQRDNFGALIKAILQAFSEESLSSLKAESEQVSELFFTATGCKLPLQARAVKVYLPTAVQGVSRVKADGNRFDPQTIDWLSLWLIANGLFTFGISERVKISDRAYDWRVTALQPKDIPLEKYREVLNRLRQYNPPGGGHGIARFDAELVLRFCQELLNHHQAQAEVQTEDDLDIWEPVNHFVGGFAGTHFGQKGQVYGVKEIFNLGLPGWIRPTNPSEILDYHAILNEHLAIISSLSVEEGHSELLTAYRGFISGNNLQNFFQFQIQYAEYIIRRLAEPKSRPPRLFSIQGMNLMTKSFKQRQDEQDWSLTEITEDPGFLRIARAINSATVYAGKIQTKNGLKELDWQRTYGLAQRLSSQSGSKKDFITELAAFLTSYENENLRISEQLQKEGKTLKRVWTTKKDLDRVIALINNDRFGCSLVANLLIAYGYAKWTKSDEVDEAKDAGEADLSVDEEAGEADFNLDKEVDSGESEDE
ncbi:hypothetical protein H6F74_28435 [Trichocoleus sp. FACHB-90]|uniref:hypothetical protein n=1 Tax=Cyanophyceae TaxID=3028117 RepID=UPI00168630FB|nr:hypothetical protein [Trichocoleus sp. FACHB-90]MBD1930118.1 hypothetical protein [Trichocoleus sp. FACHB-90]